MKKGPILYTHESGNMSNTIRLSLVTLTVSDKPEASLLRLISWFGAAFLYWCSKRGSTKNFKEKRYDSKPVVPKKSPQLCRHKLTINCTSLLSFVIFRIRKQSAGCCERLLDWYEISSRTYE